jgi:hypothetical protein
MPIFAGRKAMRLFLAAAVLGLSAPHAGFAATDEMNDDAVTVDQTIQALKDEFVLLQTDMQRAEDEYLYPPVTRVSVFLGNEVSGFLLKEIRVSVGGAQPVTYQYDEYSSRALLRRGAAQRLARLNLPRGTHRIKADFVGQWIQAEEGEAPITGQAEFNFQKDLDPADIELRIVKGPRRSGPALQLREWRAVQ